ncbi:transporter substrate-binding domain-containing protein [Candidatus Ozemobacteraceae bacterium]|nr:transporter substrate-binding domain-containing protein [Candidatus Ozemobacteraceae bacterium]
MICRRLWFLLLYTLLITASASAAGGRNVRVGVYQNEPKVFLSENGRPSGIFVDIIEQVAKDEDWHLEYVSGTWTDGLARLARGDIDLMPDVAISPERERMYAFHKEPVMSSWGQVYARPGSGIRSILDLKGRRIAVLEHSIQQTAFERLAAEFGLKPVIIPLSDYDRVFTAVAAGEADAAVANSFYGMTHFRRFGFEDTAVIFQPSSLYFAAPRGARNDILLAIDRRLRQMKENPESEYHRAMKRWLSEEPVFRLPEWVKAAAGIAVAGLLISLSGGFLLRRQVQARTLELKRANDQMVVMDRVLRDTATRLDVDAVIDNALNGVRDLTGVDGGLLCLTNRDTDELELRIIVNAPEGFEESLRTNPVRLGKGLLGHAAQLDEPSVFEENAFEHPLVTREEFRRSGIRLFAAFPLKARGGIVGILCVFSRTIARLDPMKQNLVWDICGPLALAVENARLYDQVRRHTGELERRVVERTSELQAAMEHARAADRIKSAFLATMSHELRTPLNSIIGFTGILLQGLAGPLNEEQAKQLTMVQASSRHLLALINDVLDISKIEAGQLKLSPARFDPMISLEKTVRMMQPAADKKGLDLRLETAGNLPEVTADQRRFEQILLNVVNNAVKYSERGSVVIRCRAVNEDTLTVAVSDTGIGIAREDLARLFQPFQQVDSGLTRKFEGTGLGLSISRKLLELMGGAIDVESEPGRGSTFTIRLPRLPKERVWAGNC